HETPNRDGGGGVKKPIDTGWPARRVCNCIHAVSEVAYSPLLIVGSPGYGEVASYACLLEMRRVLLAEKPQHSVISALGLDTVPIIYRDRITPPFSGTFLGPIYRVLGG